MTGPVCQLAFYICFFGNDSLGVIKVCVCLQLKLHSRVQFVFSFSPNWTLEYSLCLVLAQTVLWKQILCLLWSCTADLVTLICMSFVWVVCICLKIKLAMGTQQGQYGYDLQRKADHGDRFQNQKVRWKARHNQKFEGVFWLCWQSDASSRCFNFCVQGLA